jgi:hypothetical protein
LAPPLGRGSYPDSVVRQHQETPMFDLLFIILTIAFFLLGAAYVAACARLE